MTREKKKISEAEKYNWVDTILVTNKTAKQIREHPQIKKQLGSHNVLLLFYYLFIFIIDATFFY